MTCVSGTPCLEWGLEVGLPEGILVAIPTTTGLKEEGFPIFISNLSWRYIVRNTWAGSSAGFWPDPHFQLFFFFFLNSVPLSWGWVLPPTPLSPWGQLVGSGPFIVMTRGAVLLAASGQRPGRLLNVVHAQGLSSSKELSGSAHRWCWGWETLVLSVDGNAGYTCSYCKK